MKRDLEGSTQVSLSFDGGTTYVTIVAPSRHRAVALAHFVREVAKVEPDVMSEDRAPEVKIVGSVR